MVVFSDSNGNQVLIDTKEIRYVKELNFDKYTRKWGLDIWLKNDRLNFSYETKEERHKNFLLIANKATKGE